MAQASVTSKLTSLGSGGPAVTPAGASAPTSAGDGYGDGPDVLVPAGFIASIAAGLSGTVGEVAGTYFGYPKLGKAVGKAASPLIELLPFQVIPARVEVQGAGPSTNGSTGPAEDLVVVPASVFGGLLGGIGGKLLGGAVDKWLGGGGGTGESIGGAIGGTLGGLLPFQVVAPQVTPQSTGPIAEHVPEEPLIVVPAKFFGNLLGGVAGKFGELVGGETGKAWGEAASPILKLLPFQDVPPNLVPASAGPGGAVEERLIVVPASLFSSLLGGLADTVATEIGGFLGHEEAGAVVGGVAKGVIEMLPFHAVPDAIAPASATGGPGGDADKLMFVPASLLQGLLKGLSKTFTWSKGPVPPLTSPIGTLPF